MRISNLYTLVFMLSLLFVACEHTPEEPVGATTLTLTSDSALHFAAEGGEATITYTVENPVQGVAVETTCDALWVVELAVGESITFVVEANDSTRARTTKVEVAYASLAFEVSIEQEAGEAPADKGVKFEASILGGEYYGNDFSEAGNYRICLTDNGFDTEGRDLPNSTYYSLNLFGALFEGEGGDLVPLPVGEYILDEDNTMAEGTFSREHSGYATTNAAGERVVDAPFEAGRLLVTEEGALLTVVVAGVEHTVTFEGEATIYDSRIERGERRELDFDFAYAMYYGDRYSPATADNFFLYLSDVGVDANRWELPNGTYYRFDLFTELINREEGLYIPYGTYVIDPHDGCVANTFTLSYSGYYTLGANGLEYVEEGSFVAGTLTISDSGVVAELTTSDGGRHTVRYSGAVADIFDYTDKVASGGEE